MAWASTTAPVGGIRYAASFALAINVDLVRVDKIFYDVGICENFSALAVID